MPPKVRRASAIASSISLIPPIGVKRMREIALDVEQGADMLLVKPALPSLDILSEARRKVDLPLAAYQVSGEYAMIHAAAMQGWLDLEATALENLTCIKRAGADMIVSYFAKDAVRWLRRHKSLCAHRQVELASLSKSRRAPVKSLSRQA